jgi:hypothetical protein
MVQVRADGNGELIVIPACQRLTIKLAFLAGANGVPQARFCEGRLPKQLD